MPAFRALPRLLPPLALVALAFGLMGGLARLGIHVPESAIAQASLHGALTIACFFGTVISLERAVALDRGWAYAAPVCAALAGLALLAGAPLLLAQGLQVLAASVLVAGSASLLLRQQPLYLAILALGATAWWLGNVVWISLGLLAAVPWWLSFLILTIAGERLELTRVRPLANAARSSFIALVGLVLGGALTSRWTPSGLQLFGAGLAGLALWLMRYDIARHTVRQQGLTRYIAVCLLAGYLWLAMGGLLALTGHLAPGAPWRDGALHVLTLGFVLSMVFGHAPIILPAVAKLRVAYLPAFYLPLALLHGAVALRLAGNLLDHLTLRQAGSIAAVAALLLFIATLIAAVRRGRQPRSTTPRR